LSSQPMCFNVFGHLDAHRTSAARVLNAVLPWKVEVVDDMRVEYAPVAAAIALGDRTAFDAYVHAHASDGPTFFAFETKYTEPFSRKRYERDSYRTTTNDPGGWFVTGCETKAADPVTNQLWRNTMLAQLTEQTEPDIGTGRVIVLTAAGDAHAEAAVAGLRDHLRAPDARLAHVLLEDLIAAASEEPDLRDWASRFYDRYLDLTAAGS